jgi:hypothetical protein
MRRADHGRSLYATTKTGSAFRASRRRAWSVGSWPAASDDAVSILLLWFLKAQRAAAALSTVSAFGRHADCLP